MISKVLEVILVKLKINMSDAYVKITVMVFGFAALFEYYNTNDFKDTKHDWTNALEIFVSYSTGMIKAFQHS